MEYIIIRDGYKNDEEITLHIVGEQVIEIKCMSCKETMTVIDGKL